MVKHHKHNVVAVQICYASIVCGSHQLNFSFLASLTMHAESVISSVGFVLRQMVIVLMQVFVKHA